MKEIKFRLIRNNKIVGWEKWYAGVNGKILEANPCWLYSKDNINWFPNFIKHDTKNQFMGFKDKNGKEIYEGDIIKIIGNIYERGGI